MNEAVIKEKLNELRETISRLPKANLPAGGTSGLYISEATADDSSVEEVFETLRMQVKYMVFDIEATRRENKYLRRMLEHRPRPPRRKDDRRDDKKDDDGLSQF